MSIETSGSRVSPWWDCLSLCDGHAAQQRSSKFEITRPPTDIIATRSLVDILPLSLFIILLSCQHCHKSNTWYIPSETVTSLRFVRWINSDHFIKLQQLRALTTKRTVRKNLRSGIFLCTAFDRRVMVLKQSWSSSLRFQAGSQRSYRFLDVTTKSDETIWAQMISLMASPCTHPALACLKGLAVCIQYIHVMTTLRAFVSGN